MVTPGVSSEASDSDVAGGPFPRRRAGGRGEGPRPPGPRVTTIRIAKRAKFVRIPNASVQDRRLSFRARGLLSFLLSQPDDWRVDSDSLASHAPEGRDAIRTALNELQTTGYLVRERSRDEMGRWTTETTLHEVPGPGNPASEDQASEDQALKAKQLKQTTKSGRASPNGELTTRGSVDSIVEKYLQGIGVEVSGGGGFNLLRLIADAYSEAWADAEEAGRSPKATAVKLCAAYYEAVTDEEPDYKLIGKLVGSFGKFALAGLEAAIAHSPNDWFPYAYKVAKSREQEHRARKGERDGNKDSRVQQRLA